MKVREWMDALEADGAAWVRFRLPGGEWVAGHAHVTEVARVDKRFVDCGGTLRSESWCRLQTWVGDDIDHRLTAARLASAIGKASGVLGPDGDGLAVDVEHEAGVVSQHPVEALVRGEGVLEVRLGARHTDCLARELCVPAQPGAPAAVSIGFGRPSTAAAAVPRPREMPLVLVLCTGNSCRSHMAEGILRTLAAGRLRVASAGSRPAGYVHPLAVRAMAEIGIDISAHESKHLGTFMDQRVDTVITVCGNADAACPAFPGQARRFHWPFDDPAHATGTEEEQMQVFRRVRDEIRRVFGAYVDGRLG